MERNESETMEEDSEWEGIDLKEFEVKWIECMKCMKLPLIFENGKTKKVK